jgi:hypothetical protein
MVDFGHDFTKCDNGDGTICPMCQFKARLSTLIQRAADGHERYWDDLQGSLVDRMFDATWALHRTRRERFTDEHDEIANSWDAASMIMQLFVALNELRVRVMDDDTLDVDDDDDDADG